jgi:hypothetical protein
VAIISVYIDYFPWWNTRNLTRIIQSLYYSPASRCINAWMHSLKKSVKPEIVNRYDLWVFSRKANPWFDRYSYNSNNTVPSIGTIAGWYNIAKRKYNDWIIRVIIASDSKTTQSGGDNRKKFPLGAALQVPQFFSFAPL